MDFVERDANIQVSHEVAQICLFVDDARAGR
jgi:hypothetical protein